MATKTRSRKVTQAAPLAAEPSSNGRSSWITAGSKIAGVMLGDSASMLKQLPDETFNIAVTSPPYYWVRDYGYDGQVGHEERVDAYVEALMKVFDEVKRTLHPEGVFFLNIGDTYYSGNGQPHGSDPRSSSRNFARTKMRPVDKSGWESGVRHAAAGMDAAQRHHLEPAERFRRTDCSRSAISPV